MKQYVKVVHKGRGFNVRIELPDGSTQLIPKSDLSSWEKIEDSSKQGEGVDTIKVKKEQRAKKTRFNSYKRGSNGLGASHPYECVDFLTVESVVYEDGIESPF